MDGTVIGLRIQQPCAQASDHVLQFLIYCFWFGPRYDLLYQRLPRR